jgi:hypothetical protein
MEAHFMTSIVNPLEEARDWRIVKAIGSVESVGRVSGHEVERTSKAVSLARLHQQVERVERVSVDTPYPSVKERSGPTRGKARVAAADDIASRGASDAEGALAQCCPWLIYIVGHPKPEDRRPPENRRPEGMDGIP